jgi:hypothetical protein
MNSASSSCASNIDEMIGTELDSRGDKADVNPISDAIASIGDEGLDGMEGRRFLKMI